MLSTAKIFLNINGGVSSHKDIRYSTAFVSGGVSSSFHSVSVRCGLVFVVIFHLILTLLFSSPSKSHSSFNKKMVLENFDNCRESFTTLPGENNHKKMQKAWFYEEHGPPEVLQLGYLPVPSPKENQLLVCVRAAALNPIDFKLRQKPLVSTTFPVVPGCDMAGVVVAKGDGISRFCVGDEVYGNIQDFNAEGSLKQLGVVAEFILVEENLVARKPENLSFEEAASLPVALQTAVEGFKVAGFKKGQTVFIVGGAGGVGTLAVQLAKHFYGASFVTATTSTPKVEFVKGLGADKVVDYRETKYEEVEEKYDLVYDTIGDSKYSYVVAKDDMPIIDITWPPSNPRAIHSGLTVSGELRPYLESGKLKAAIDPRSPFHFCDAINAFRYLETGRARGKVVISPFPS